MKSKVSGLEFNHLEFYIVFNFYSYLKNEATLLLKVTTLQLQIFHNIEDLGHCAALKFKIAS